MSKWFIETGSHQIEGPFTTEAIQNRLQAGQLSPSDQIWGRVLEEWKPVSWWASSLGDLLKHEKKIANPEVWHYAQNGSTFGPLSWVEMVRQLKNITTRSIEELIQIKIWTQGMKDWGSLTEFHELMDALGVNKRSSPRAPITGQAVVKSQGQTWSVSLKTIGEGGFGTEPLPGLIAGETVTVEIKSPSLNEAVRAKAQVQYSTDNMVGFKFNGLNVEGKGCLVQYVRKFSQSPGYFLKAA